MAEQSKATWLAAMVALIKTNGIKAITGSLFQTLLANLKESIVWRDDGGTWTPTLTNGANVAASTAFVCQYIRAGSVVTCSGVVNIDPTSASVSTVLGISLPFASDFTAVEQCGGVAACGSVASYSAVISADTTNNRANLRFINGTDVANNTWGFTFTYLIV